MDEEATNALYVLSRESGAGSLVLSLGLMERIRRRFARVALFRPVCAQRDPDLELLAERFALEQPAAQRRGVSPREAEELLAKPGGEEELIERVLERYRPLERAYDFVLVLGTELREWLSAPGTDPNLIFARNLSAPVAGVFDAGGMGMQELRDTARLWASAIEESGCELFVLCANRASEDLCKVREEANADLPLFCLPRMGELERFSVGELKRALSARWIVHRPRQETHPVEGWQLASGESRGVLERLRPYELIVTASERWDLVAAMMLSAESVATPMSSALLLCGKRPAKKMVELLEGCDTLPLPILHSSEDEVRILRRLDRLRPEIRPDEEWKIATVLGAFERWVDPRWLEGRLRTPHRRIVTPAMFRLRLFERAARDPRRIVLPEIDDDRILKAADLLLRRGIVEIVLVGTEEEIARRCRALGVDLGRAGHLNPEDPALLERFARSYYRLRRRKGVTEAMAADRVRDRTVFATMAVKEGLADGMVSGATHSTRETILPALRVIGLRPGYSLASSCFFMCLPTKVLVYADCAVVPDPSAEDLVQIALETAETARHFGIEVRVAMLSYSSGSSGVGPDVEKVRRATELLRARRPELPLTGPIQYDAAVDPEVARLKMPGDPVAGHATVLIFPDLDTGNIAYKAVQRSSGAVAVGPVMQGLRRPVNDLSRGCSVDDVIDTVAITAIQAQENPA